eukprot:gene7009-8145_t
MTSTTTISVQHQRHHLDDFFGDDNSSGQVDVDFEKSLSSSELYQRIGTIQSLSLEQKNKNGIITGLVECTFHSDEDKTAKWKDCLNEVCTLEFHIVHDHKPIKSLLYIGGNEGPSSTYSHCIITDKWTEGTKLPSPIPYVWNSVNTGSAIYCFGGGDVNAHTYQKYSLLWDTKEIKELLPMPPKIKNQIPHRLVFDHHKQMIYSLSGSDARYYSIASNEWVRFKESVPKKFWCSAVEAIYE